MLKILKPALAPGRAFNFKTNKKSGKCCQTGPNRRGAVYFFL
jgi:hypothetical protein